MKQSERSIEGLMPGMLLLAHPAMRDPNFARAVILLTAYDEDSGAIGVVFNQPLKQALGSLVHPLADSQLREVPLYRGGPVAPEQLVISAWRWDLKRQAHFQLFFGITAERAQMLSTGKNPFHLRAFLGYAGWGEGQLEEEIEQGAWVCQQVQPELENADGEQLWKYLVCASDPLYRILCEEPDDPSLN
jgi:putative transcriptional regulator